MRLLQGTMIALCVVSLYAMPMYAIIPDTTYIRTPLWMSQKIIGMLPSTTPHEWMVVKDATHGGKEDPIWMDLANFLTRVSHFMHTYLQ